MRANILLNEEAIVPFKLTDKQISVLEMIVDSPTTYIDSDGKIAQHKALEVFLYGGARSAKTFLNCLIVITRALKERSRHIILRESFTSVDRSILHDTWPKVMQICFPELSGRVVMRQKPPFATFPNGSEVWFSGLEDNDTGSEKILGNEFSTAFLNEASEVWLYSNYTKVMTRLSEKNSLRKMMLVDENPPAKMHWTYTKFMENRDPASRELLSPMAVKTLKVMQMNPVDNVDNIDGGMLETLRSGSEDDRIRFYHGQFLDTVRDGVYTTALNRAELDIPKRITKVGINKDYPFNAVFDIGYSDYTSIWFCQFLKDKVLLLEYYQNNHMTLEDYIRVIFTKYGHLDQMILPHDSAPNNWSTGRSHYEVARSWGRKKGFKVRLLHQPLSMHDGIDATRTLFDIMWFDAVKCADGLDVLRNYRYDKSKRLGMYKDKPLHDKYSHGADALRYVSDAYNGKYVTDPLKPLPPPDPKEESWITHDQVFADRDERIRRAKEGIF
ncbi:hypothetical protein FACS189496_3650 [Bacilli bacterium]|nr:hypothetical protein FACS189496_3650 [Bacilli bacterium]